MELRNDVIQSNEWMKIAFGWPVVLLLCGGLYWLALDTGFNDPARWPELLELLRAQLESEPPPVYIGGFMALVFLFIVIKLLVDTVSVFRFGLTSLQLDPNPGSVGGHLGGVFRLGYSLKPDDSVTVTVVCWRHYVRRSRGKRESKRDRFWSEDLRPEVNQQFDKLQVRFTVDLPGHLPASGEQGDDTFRWEVILRVDRKGRDIVRQFKVPVEKTSSPRHAAQPMRSDQPSAKGIPGMVVEENGSRLHIRGLPGRQPGMHLGLLVFGAIFAGTGGWLGVGVAWPHGLDLASGTDHWIELVTGAMFVVIPGFMSLVFAAIGGLVFLSGVAGLLNRRELRIDDSTIWTRNRGTAAEHSLSGVSHFELAETGSMGTDTSHDLSAVIADKQPLTVLQGIPGKIAARQIVEIITRKTGLEVKDVGRSQRLAKRFAKTKGRVDSQA